MARKLMAQTCPTSLTQEALQARRWGEDQKHGALAFAPGRAPGAAHEQKPCERHPTRWAAPDVEPSD